MSTVSITDWLVGELGSLKRNTTLPRYRRIYDGLRKAILERRIAAGTRLPSTREMALELNVSRNTIITAFDQLLAEGYIEAATGSGTYVADINAWQELDDNAAASGKNSASSAAAPAPGNVRPPRLSERGRRLTATDFAGAREIQPFVPGMDDFSVFPLKLWQRLLNKYLREARTDLLDYGTAGGYLPLRRAIADYVSIARSARVAPEQVLITAGTQHSIQLCAQLLANPGDLAWVEDPGYWGARRAIESCDLHLHPVAVDREGIRPSAGDSESKPALIYVTPSHHYPTSVVMSLARRRQLLDIAARLGAWILEDDYDSEFRYRGRPSASLQGLDTNNSVIYLGTFSKILYPGIKLGYMIVPKAVVEPFKTALNELQRPGQMILQATLADFIDQGHFATHVRKVRQVYGERREILIKTLRPILGKMVRTQEASGLHLMIELATGANDVALAALAASLGIIVRPLSIYAMSPDPPKGLLVGFAYVPTHEIARHASKLGEIVKRGLRSYG